MSASRASSLDESAAGEKHAAPPRWVTNFSDQPVSDAGEVLDVRSCGEELIGRP
jgi:hypothetical protein